MSGDVRSFDHFQFSGVFLSPVWSDVFRPPQELQKRHGPLRDLLGGVPRRPRPLPPVSESRIRPFQQNFMEFLAPGRIFLGCRTAGLCQD